MRPLPGRPLGRRGVFLRAICRGAWKHRTPQLSFGAVNCFSNPPTLPPLSRSFPVLFSQQDTGPVRSRVRPKERTQTPVTGRAQSEAGATGAGHRKPLHLPRPLDCAGAGQGGGPPGGGGGALHRGAGCVPTGCCESAPPRSAVLRPDAGLQGRQRGVEAAGSRGCGRRRLRAVGTGGQAGSTCSCCTEPVVTIVITILCLMTVTAVAYLLFSITPSVTRNSGIQDLSLHSSVGHLRVAGLVADLAGSPENPTLCFLSLPLIQTVLPS